MNTLSRSDRLSVYAQGVLSPMDHQVLALLYQPIIGVFAYTFYHTLWCLTDRQTGAAVDYVHADLESLLNRKIEDIEKDRYRLEAIGLLDVYYLGETFTYELKLPMSAQCFINDGVMGQYLIQAITKTRFIKLVELFKLKKPVKGKWIHITKSFDEVFPAIDHTDEVQTPGLSDPIRSKTLRTNGTFNWRVFTDGLSEDFFDPNLLNETTKMKINNLHYVYDIDELVMRDLYLKAVDSHQRVDLVKLAVLAREAYRDRHQALTHDHTVEPEVRNIPHDPVEYFKTMSPRLVLEEMGGGQASAADLRIAERLLEDVGLDRGVVNVLLAYVAKIKEGILPGYPYFEKIGLSWKNNQIDSVETAMAYVEHLRSTFQKNQNAMQQRSSKGKRVANKPDVTIDWLEDYLKTIE